MREGNPGRVRYASEGARPSSEPSGTAYAFIEPAGAFLAGHVGWGFKQRDGRFYYGSTQNWTRSMPYVEAGDDNGWWAEQGNFAAMRLAFRIRNYYWFKAIPVAGFLPEVARLKADATRGMGYGLLGNNCMDHAFKVLEAYGTKNIPWPVAAVICNVWFSLIQVQRTQV